MNYIIAHFNNIWFDDDLFICCTSYTNYTIFGKKKPSSFFSQSQRNYAELKEVAAEEDLEDYIA